MTATEILVHEAGHNAAEVFQHGKYDDKVKYEYEDIGLSSNQNTFVYPTESNTMEIIKDSRNRQNMKTL